MPAVIKDGAINEKGEDKSINSIYTITPEESKSQLSIVDEIPSAEPPAPPYHVFTERRKMLMLFIVSLGGFFSPLSSNIYFPALGDISEDLHVSAGLVALTITVYMAVQGIAPSFWAPFADIYGRRVVFIGTFSVYLVANVALGLVDNFIALMIFRGLQAAGSAATISIGSGVIGDIATSAERGGYVGIYGGVRMLGQSIGPVFGGILTQFLGFRSIFWSLTILGAIALFLILFFLPETLRSVAGNGTVQLTGIHKPFLYHFKPQPDVETAADPNRPRKKLTVAAFFDPLRFLFEKDVFATLLFGGIVYTIWSMITSSTTTLFRELYHIEDLVLGLAFLPNGAGCVIGSYAAGMLMDFDYKRTLAEYHKKHSIPEGKVLSKSDIKNLADFSIERARLRSAPWFVLLFVGTVAAYGLSLTDEDIDRPLILQFFISSAATALFSINSALTIDLYPGASASATAVNNLIRCSIGAVGVAIVEPLLQVLDPQWTFIMLSGIALVASPLLFIEMRWGQRWRQEREARLARRQALNV
ncbi:major facilitator superfamily domain-containing protein [Macrophomina phaseolina]|uniref:Major facilitator superfamily domain-containing protein n=1 Tax=Macrophomina phaseolina TaxID=35725 RepID=A0ABQ8GQT9_9PEZI|nr:major facilitator superfamily domain-containing protein [Macrophomina phaseolina]